MTEALFAHVRYSPFFKSWTAEVREDGGDGCLYFSNCWGNEAAAKAAISAWIGKTMAQLGNALAAGEPQVDEE